MIAACRTSGVLLGVNAVTRWRAGVRQESARGRWRDRLRPRMVRHTYAHPRGRLCDGRPLDPGSAAGSPFLDQGAHCNDAIRWFVGRPHDAFAQYASFTGTEPAGQSAMVQFGFANGAMCQIWASYEWPEAPDPDNGPATTCSSARGHDRRPVPRPLDVHRGANGWETLYTHPPVAQPEPTRLRLSVRGADPGLRRVIREGRSRRSTARPPGPASRWLSPRTGRRPPGEVVQLPLEG